MSQELVYDIWVPIGVSLFTFLVSAVVWKLFRARIPYIIINSFSFAVLPLIVLRKFNTNGCDYVVTAFDIIEAVLFVLATILTISLNTYNGCIANERRQCCVCCRMKRELRTPTLYDDAMFENVDPISV